MAGRVTIQDIADALGVSRNTVSKAINNTGVLADATRDKILQKAVEMGYKQFSYVSLASQGNLRSEDSSAQLSLNTVLSPGIEPDSSAARPRNIALLTTTLINNSHFSSTMLDKMQRELSQLGYSISMHRVLRAEVQALKLPNSFIKEQTAAVICIEIFDEAYGNMIRDLGLPTLFIDCPAEATATSMRADRLLMDNRSGIYAFIKEMKRRGKTRIGFLGASRHCMSFYERYIAFREGLIFLDLPYDPEYCLTDQETLSDKIGVSHYRDYLRVGLTKMQKKGLPDVFICANDFVALDALQIFKELGISVPEDVYLCGFDDSPESRVVTPPLTTIHIHSQIMGFSAVHLLLSRINNPTMNYRTIYTETSLIYRESTGD